MKRLIAVVIINERISNDIGKNDKDLVSAGAGIILHTSFFTKAKWIMQNMPTITARVNNDLFTTIKKNMFLVHNYIPKLEAMNVGDNVIIFLPSTDNNIEQLFRLLNLEHLKNENKKSKSSSKNRK